MEKLGRLVKQLNDYVSTGIWRIRLSDLPKGKAFFIRQLRIAIYAVNGFKKDRCLLRASALTFYSLLSIVPVAAMAFGIAKGFGFEKNLEAQLFDRFPGQEEVVGQVITYANSFLENTRGGVIAAVGVAVLFWTVVKVLSHIEHAFNHIWNVRLPRNFGRKFSDYLSIMLVGPILVIMSGSAQVFIMTQVTTITEKIALLKVVSPLILFSLRAIPYALIWALFTITYLLMPNTRVKLSSGLLAGIISGTAYQIIQWTYIHFQVGVAKYNAIYGSFAALPLFLAWLQISWIVVLAGAEISCAHQTVNTHEFEPELDRINFSHKKRVALAVCHLIIKRFSSGEPLMSAEKIAQELTIPIRLTQRILDDLVETQILSVTIPLNNQAPAYIPARDINQLTVQSIVNALEQQGVDTIPLSTTPGIDTLNEILEKFQETLITSSENRLLKDI